MSNAHSTLFPGYKHADVVPKLRNKNEMVCDSFSKRRHHKGILLLFPNIQTGAKLYSNTKIFVLESFQKFSTVIRLWTEYDSNGAQIKNKRK